MADRDSADGGSSVGLHLLPPLWAAVVMAVCAWALWTTWQGFYIYELPDSVVYFIYASLAESVLYLFWSLWLLVLAVNRSPLFPKQFIAWGVVLIALTVLRQVYVLFVPDFVFDARNLAQAIAEIGITAFCIFVLRQKDGTASRAYVSPGSSQPSVLATLLGAFFGLVLGGLIGFGVGLGAGVLFVEIADVSCFEGACGYAAVFIALAGAVIGAIVGAVGLAWLVNRRRRISSAA